MKNSISQTVAITLIVSSFLTIILIVAILSGFTVTGEREEPDGTRTDIQLVPPSPGGPASSSQP